MEDLFFVSLGFACVLIIVWIFATVSIIISSIKPIDIEYQTEMFDH